MKRQEPSSKFAALHRLPSVENIRGDDAADNNNALMMPPPPPSCYSQLRMNDFPYRILQNVASFLNFDDRYRLAETCIEFCDAVDSDYVWIPSIGSMPRFTERLEARLPHDELEDPDVRAKRMQKLFSVVERRLPASVRCNSEAFHRFRVMAVSFIIPRTVNFLSHDYDREYTLNILKDLFRSGMRQQLQDEMNDVFGPRDLRVMARRKKVPKMLLQCCAEINKYAHEVMLATASVEEFKVAAGIAGVFNLVSAVGYSYLRVIDFFTYLVLKFLNSRSDKWKNFFSNFITESTRSKVFLETFVNFPKHPTDPTGVVYKRNPAVELATPSSLIVAVVDHHQQATSAAAAAATNTTTASSAAVATAATTVAQNILVESVASSVGSGVGGGGGVGGLPGSHVSTWVALSACSGVLASYMGGRCPSVHQVPTKFTLKANLWFKLLYDILRSTMQRNFDAFILYTLLRVSTIPESLRAAGTGIGKLLTENALARLWRQAYGATVGRVVTALTPAIVPKFRDGLNKALDNVVNRLVTHPVEKYITAPLHRTKHFLFGNMSIIGVASFAISTAISTSAQLVIEYNRNSWRQTVTSRRRKTVRTLLSHAAFAVSLSLLRWRLYCAGASFWKVAAIEASVRMSVSMAEVVFARLCYEPPTEHANDVVDADYSDDDW